MRGRDVLSAQGFTAGAVAAGLVSAAIWAVATVPFERRQSGLRATPPPTNSARPSPARTFVIIEPSRAASPPPTSPPPSRTSSGPARRSDTTAGAGLTRPSGASSAPAPAAIVTAAPIQDVAAAQVSATSFRLTWSNPDDPSIAGWIISQYPKGGGGRASGEPYTDPRSSTTTINTAAFEAEFQFSAGQQWQICIEPYGHGIDPDGTYPEMPEREGCAPTITWH